MRSDDGMDLSEAHLYWSRRRKQLLNAKAEALCQSRGPTICGQAACR